MRELIRKFLRDTGGNFVMIVALASPVLMLLSAGAMDMARYRGSVDELQNIADFAAIAGAREMILANADQNSIQAQVNSVITSRMNSKFSGKSFTKVVEVRMDEAEVFVSLSMQVNGMLGQNLFPDNGLVKADSTAIATASSKICAISLDPTHQNNAFHAENNTRLEALGCSIYANSTHPNAAEVSNGAEVVADLLCVSGGFKANGQTNSPGFIDGCPQLDDPLKDRAAPTFFAGCDHLDLDISEYTTSVLNPGVYCDGLKIKHDAQVTFMPGTYIIKDGPFIVEQEAIVEGKEVAFYFTGDNSSLKFEDMSEINLSAPINGDMAGMLFMEDRDKDNVEDFEILTSGARELLGTIYLPKGKLYVDTNNSVGQDSAFTVILANELHLHGSASLYLNSDYASTPVPVPEGVGPVGGSAYLKN
ncbi:MAG: pilus assembly protein [Aquisalinus sp.]|nr:pilus assembly protein [Aquisalinus sp.]